MTPRSTPTTSASDTNHQQRLQALDAIAREKGWRVVQDATMKILDGSCLYHIASEGRHYENFVFGDDWEYAEIGFDKRGYRPGSNRRRPIVHYGVMSVTLPRKLPNVVFDSLKHQRRQFKLIFEKDQLIQLEGMFDKHFATYFGNDYTIDDLSFITPEVMEALIAADEYDIEIVHNRLLIFGPIQSDALAQLEDMSKALQLIRKKLLHNILTYRDERVAYDSGRKVVARAGMFLDRAPFGSWYSVLALLYLIGGFFIFALILYLLTAFTEFIS